MVASRVRCGFRVQVGGIGKGVADAEDNKKQRALVW